ncbi:MHS family MFS transporter [Micrococcales bacterium 31B]|nr:MHS family MFS transporter [Micrococcales bacterium 31B]
MSATTQPQTATQTPKRAALASFLGSAVEYYDFFIFGTASALIFPTVFFGGESGATGGVYSALLFAAAYVVRPVGAFILGHFGDRIGRQKLLLFTLLLMGCSTFVIGILPSTDTIGETAIVLLLLCRIAQGLSAAGEQAGASSMTMEHSPDGKRAFYASFTLSGTQAGQILAILIFIPIGSLPDEQLFSWGWRIPFILSALVVLVAFFVRRTLHEPPSFEAAKAAGKIAKLPVADLFKHHTADVLRVILCALIAVVSTIFSVATLTYAVKQVGIPQADMLWIVAGANFVMLFTQPMWAIVADRVGRKPVFIGGALGSAVFAYVYFWSVTTANLWLIFGCAVLFLSVAYAACNAIWPSFYSEMFSSKVRYSGVAIGTQIGFLGAGFAPAIATALAGSAADWVPIASVAAVACVISALSAFTAKETAQVSLGKLGQDI